MNAKHHSNELDSCFYYPACGTDLQPLLRFSHRTDFFVFADSQYSEKDLDDRIAEALSQPPFLGLLELIGEPAYVSEEDLGGHMTLPEHLRRRLIAHEANRHEVFPRRHFAREYSFNRIIGGERRRLRILYVAGEAMATYDARFGSCSINPQFLCTIQSQAFGGDDPAALEAAEGLHEEFLTHFGGPQFWLRGSWIPIEDTDPTRVAARAEGAWDRVVQSYTGWECRHDDPQFPKYAHVTAFSRQNDLLELDTETQIGVENGRSIWLVKGKVERAELVGFQAFDAAFLDPRTAERLQGFQTPVYVHGGGTLAEELERIEQIATENDYRRIVMTGCGYEDEGSYLHSWASGDGLPVEVEMRFVNDLDLADQRGWGLH